jgi:hypothetical protein
LHLRFFVQGNFRDFTVVAPEPNCFLMTVRCLAAHLDPAHRAPAFADDDSFDGG